MTPILAGVALLWSSTSVERYSRFTMDEVPLGFTVEATGREWSLRLRSEWANVVLARGSAGSVAFRYTGAIEYPLGVARRKDEHWFITPMDGYVSIDHSKRTVRVDGHLGLPGPEWDRLYDPVCERERKGLSQAWGDVRMIDHRDVAGYRVVAYSVSSPYGSGTVAFAPDLGCMTMSIREVSKNGWRIPVTFGYWEVTAVRRGEPDPALMQKPAGYRVVEE